MAVNSKGVISIPTLLFHEGEGLTLTVETKSGTMYRGIAAATDDYMNVRMSGVTAVEPDGTTRQMDMIFIRGSTILYTIFPYILSKAPFFERVRQAAAGKVFVGGLGRGRQQAIQQKGMYMVH